MRSWYKHSVPACFKEKPIAFIGYARGHQGGIPQMGEMQARLVSLCLAGKDLLPADFAKRAVQEGKDEDAYYLLAPALKPLVDYPSYMDSMSKLIGCEPNVPWGSPSMMFKFMYYPLWPAWYRFRGPGANPTEAQALFDQFPIMKWFKVTPLFIFNTISYFWTKLISTLLFFVPFMPKCGVDKLGLFLFCRPKQFVLHGNKYTLRDLFRP